MPSYIHRHFDNPDVTERSGTRNVHLIILVICEFKVKYLLLFTTEVGNIEVFGKISN